MGTEEVVITLSILHILQSRISSTPAECCATVNWTQIFSIPTPSETAVIHSKKRIQFKESESQRRMRWLLSLSLLALLERSRSFRVSPFRFIIQWQVQNFMELLAVSHSFNFYLVQQPQNDATRYQREGYIYFEQDMYFVIKGTFVVVSVTTQVRSGFSTWYSSSSHPHKVTKLPLFRPRRDMST